MNQPNAEPEVIMMCEEFRNLLEAELPNHLVQQIWALGLALEHAGREAEAKGEDKETCRRVKNRFYQFYLDRRYGQ